MPGDKHPLPSIKLSQTVPVAHTIHPLTPYSDLATDFICDFVADLATDLATDFVTDFVTDSSVISSLIRHRFRL
jgi:hypothetical protein